MTATLAQLVEVRSQLAEALLDYLKSVETALAKNALLDRFGRKLDDVRVPLKVVPFQPERHRAEAAETEHLRLPTPSRDEDEPAKKRYAGLREDKEPAHPPQPLSTVELLLQHAVLLADPGGGKTEWLKDLARRRASRSREDLGNRTITPTDVVIPVFLRLPELAKTLAEETPEILHAFLVQRDCVAPSSVLNEAQRVAAAILRTLLRQSVLPESLVRFVWEKWFPAERIHLSSFIPHPPLLCLDAWDEVRNGRETLANCLLAFAAESDCRIFLTSRIAGYDLCPLPVESKDEGTQRELRICTFEWNETEQFVTRWFRASEAERGQQMIAELRQKIAVFGMAGNPLIVTLLCLAYSPNARQELLPFPLRRGPVYQCILQGLLGEWPRRRGEEVVGPKGLTQKEKERMAAKLALLAEVAPHFFWRGEVRFSRTALEAAMHDYLSSAQGELLFAETALHWRRSLTAPEDDTFARLPESAKQKWTEKNVVATLCHELIEEDGLLTVEMETDHETWYGFLHLTLHEYLTASGLARKVNQSGWEAEIEGADQCVVQQLLDRKAWDPYWNHVLTLLAGQLNAPMPLLALLADEQRDNIYRHRLALAALCLSEISEERLWDIFALQEQVADGICARWQANLGTRTTAVDWIINLAVASVWSSYETLAMSHRMIAKLDFSLDENCMWELVALAQTPEMRDFVVKFLIQSVAGETRRKAASDRYWIYHTLGEIGGSEIEKILKLGLNEEDEWARTGAEEALAYFYLPESKHQV